MERARTTGSERDAALRRVAIVLSSLPQATATQLLGSVDPGAKRLIHHTMNHLADVDPLERHRALQAFKGSFGSAERGGSGDTYQRSAASRDEFSFEGGTPSPPAGSRIVPSGSPETRTMEEPSASDTSPPKPDSPLSFLHGVDSAAMVELLQGEHPQTVALILASIAPDQAARVLPRLDAALQTDALSRIGRLGEMPDDALSEIASHIRSRVDAQRQTTNPAGQRALGAILAALPTQASEEASRSVPVSDPVSAPAADPVNLSALLGRETAAAPRSEPKAAATGYRSEADLSAIDQTHRLRLVTAGLPDEIPGNDSPTLGGSGADPAHPEPEVDRAPETDSFGSTDQIHAHLIGLSSSELCVALGQVSTRQAMLALCGLPNDVAQGVLAVLPRSQAKQVRRGMSSLRSIELREIDEAKEAVAIASTASEAGAVPAAA